MECLARAGRRSDAPVSSLFAPPRSRGGRIADAPIASGYGAAIPVRPRLGQRSFRVAVLDSYGRRCAITNEKTLPVLEAAHIREYHDLPVHSINNGIHLRADIHKLFDSGYVTVTPEYQFEVSRRIKEEFENGRDYYALHASRIRLPQDIAHRPAVESLIWAQRAAVSGVDAAIGARRERGCARVRPAHGVMPGAVAYATNIKPRFSRKSPPLRRGNKKAGPTSAGGRAAWRAVLDDYRTAILASCVPGTDLAVASGGRP